MCVQHIYFEKENLVNKNVIKVVWKPLHFRNLSLGFFQTFLKLCLLIYFEYLCLNGLLLLPNI